MTLIYTHACMHAHTQAYLLYDLRQPLQLFLLLLKTTQILLELSHNARNGSRDTLAQLVQYRRIGQVSVLMMWQCN